MPASTTPRPRGGNGDARPYADAIADAKRRNNIGDLAPRYSTGVKRAGPRKLKARCPNPAHEDKNPSCEYDLARQRWICWSCGQGGDAIDLVMVGKGVDLLTALELLGEDVAGRTEPAPRPEPPPPTARGISAQAQAYFDRSPELTPGCPAAAYLAGRNCAMPLNDVRWRAGVEHPSGYTGPCLVALVTDAVTAEPLSVHRTWLARDGSAKAPVDKPRLFWPGLATAGGVVRLVEDAEVTTGLCIAEGLETALSAAVGFGPGCWATLSAGNLAAFPVLDAIESLTIVPDRDKHGRGQRAAATCAARWSAAGKEVRLWRGGSIGTDFNDFATESVT